MLARRKRIQERLAALRTGDVAGASCLRVAGGHGASAACLEPQAASPARWRAGGDVGDKKEELGRGKQQIIESKRKLYRVKHRTDQDVTSVRTGGDEREQAHRVAEENTRQVSAPPCGVWAESSLATLRAGWDTGALTIATTPPSHTHTGAACQAAGRGRAEREAERRRGHALGGPVLHRGAPGLVQRD